jgi:hypothetical protein
MEFSDYLEVDFLPFTVNEIILGVFVKSLLLRCGLPFKRAVLTLVHKAHVTGLEITSALNADCHGASISTT